MTEKRWGGGTAEPWETIGRAGRVGVMQPLGPAGVITANCYQGDADRTLAHINTQFHTLRKPNALLHPSPSEPS